MVTEPENEQLAFPKVLEDGLVIVGILFTWGVFSVIGIGLSNIGGPGSYLIPIGEAITQLFILAGVANTLLYVIARGIELSDG